MSEQIDALMRSLDGPGAQSPEREELLRAIITRVVELAKIESNAADLRIALTALNELLEASTLFASWREQPKVTVFGSARTKVDNPLYEMARGFGEAIAKRGWMMVSGAGPGIMEASSKGSGRENTLGVNIELPFEQGANDFIDVDKMHVAMSFFFTRKVALTRASQAFVAFPGGVGTMDELFEILTLVHTGKTDPAPIVLIDVPGGTFWRQWSAFMQVLVRDAYIDAIDIALFTLCESIDGAIDEIEHFYRNYVALAVEDGRARMDLRHGPDAMQLAALATTFPQFVTARGFEFDEGALHFDFDGRNYVTLRLLINEVNGWTSP